MNFTLNQKFHYSLDELDMMMPWEREIYTELLINDLKQQEAKQKGMT